MWFYFTHKNMPYSSNKGPTFGPPKTHSFYYSTNAAHSRGSITWNNLRDLPDLTEVQRFIV